MKIKYFKTIIEAQTALAKYIESMYDDKFQDAREIARLTIVESPRGFAVRRGTYGIYLTTAAFLISIAIAKSKG